MTSKNYQALGLYYAVAMVALSRLHTGNLWIRLGVSVATFFLVPTAAYAWSHRLRCHPERSARSAGAQSKDLGSS